MVVHLYNSHLLKPVHVRLWATTGWTRPHKQAADKSYSSEYRQHDPDGPHRANESILRLSSQVTLLPATYDGDVVHGILREALSGPRKHCIVNKSLQDAVLEDGSTDSNADGVTQSPKEGVIGHSFSCLPRIAWCSDRKRMCDSEAWEQNARTDTRHDCDTNPERVLSCPCEECHGGHTNHQQRPSYPHSWTMNVPDADEQIGDQCEQSQRDSPWEEPHTDFREADVRLGDLKIQRLQGCQRARTQIDTSMSLTRKHRVEETMMP
jgi:hypothetical protein